MHSIAAIFLAVTVVSATPVAAAGLREEFIQGAASIGIRPTAQAACVKGPVGEELSYNQDMRIIPASVSKLYVFDWALTTLPKNFRYTTTFYVNGSTLYINGGGDPHFVIEHLRSIINKVYAENNVRLTAVVFSPDFYFNWQSNQTDVRSSLISALKADTTLPIAKTITIQAASAPYSGKGKQYEFRSMPLPALLKQINDYSTNISADVLFRRLGGPSAFSAYMKKTYGVGSETISFVTGSGLSGNSTTCALTLRVLGHLGETLKQKDLALTDILSMPTVDPGVLQKRVISPSDAQSIVAKSGFVNNHHALAGAINTTAGPVYFAIFTTYDRTSQSEKTKLMIDSFLGKIAASYRRSLKSFGYTPDLTIFKNVKISRAGQ